MPVLKFRSVDGAAEIAWCRPEDPSLAQVIRAVWRRGHWLAPWRLEPGVYRHRTMADANAQRLAWECTRVEPRFRPAVRKDDEPER